jgi:superfamily I DNA/RNA helicase
MLDEIFGIDKKQATEKDYRIGTIHSIKGETFEAVLVILKQKGIGSYYKIMLKKKVPISDNEELRIVYVGITRPRQLLVLAVPNEQNKTAWEAKLFDN